MRDNTIEIVAEGVLGAESGMRAALIALQELQELLMRDNKPETQIRIVKEIAHQLTSWTFWMEQKEFWEKRKSFQAHIAKQL